MVSLCAIQFEVSEDSDQLSDDINFNCGRSFGNFSINIIRKSKFFFIGKTREINTYLNNFLRFVSPGVSSDFNRTYLPFYQIRKSSLTS